MARPQRLGLSAVRSEGAILPPSILQRIHREDPSLGGMSPDEFGLSGMRVREAASQAWNALQAPWRTFQVERARLGPGEAGTGMTRNRWLNQIAKALDFGAIDPLRASVEAGDRSFALSHLYRQVPIHWVGCGLELDRPTAGEKGAAKMSPHGLVQLLLNASDDYLWGFVSNGLQWRILRDDNSLSRQSLVEFDLEAIFEGQLYDEFLLFYLLCHQTRVRAEKPEEYWLERWSQAAANEGKRALDTLRNGVEKAIETLGQGFLKHPANQALRQSLRDGELDKQGYYRQLLRLVYRLLFLFVAEDRVDAKGRSLLHVPEATDEARSLYAEHYSTQRLRLLAERLRGSHRHHDLFQQLRLVLEKLGEEEGCPELGLPALGGFLFSADACPDLDRAELSNGDLLEAIRCLAVTQEGGRRTRVDYKNLASEEMGSVYESLLELHPDLSTDGTKFELRSASGNERKTTGSYYTPDSLIQCLLDTALDPVVDEAVRTARQNFPPKDGEPPAAQAILALKVIDPAVGSGHFLIAAAHRMAKRLAQARTGDDEPAPDTTRRALRDVIGRCLYGIDVNPMSAELCKVALWMESLEPGKPLSFLDHHIVVGNSLLGATPKLIAAGIPDDAYTPIEGDDKAVCTALKRQNRAERDGQGNLFSPEVYSGQGLLSAWERLEGLSDESFKSVRKKAQEYREAKAAVGMRQRLADAWCAAFVVPKVPASVSGLRGITTSTLRMLAAGRELDAPTARAVGDAAARFGLLHPHLTFPDVFARGGFDVVLGNPPWERIKLQEKEFFAERVPEIATATHKSERTRLLLQLHGTALHHEYLQAKRDADAASLFIRKSGRFPLSGRGDVNTYLVFAELKRNLLNDRGRVGCIVPTGVATDDTAKFFFQHLVENQVLHSYYGFKNERFLFPKPVEHTVTFGLLTVLGVECRSEVMEFSWLCWTPEEMKDPSRRITLTPDDISLLNPNTRTCPAFRTERDAEITKSIYRRVPVFVRETESAANPWGITFRGMLHMSSDSHLFREWRHFEAANAHLIGNEWEVSQTVKVEGLEVRQGRWLPLYEAKMIHHFDHRWATYGALSKAKGKKAIGEIDTRDVTAEEKRDANFVVMPRYWVQSQEMERIAGLASPWFIGFRDICRSTDVRTAIFSAIPRVPSGNSLPLAITSVHPTLRTCLLSNLSAFAFDFPSRFGVGGTHLNFFILQQLPVLPPASYAEKTPWCRNRLFEWIVPRTLELTFTARDLGCFAKDIGFEGEPFLWDESRRDWLRAELDAAFFHLYGVGRDDVDYILDTFHVVKQDDEKTHGSYRTKELILEVYDAMAQAIRTGVPYQPKLDPPPANGWTPPPLPPLEELVPQTPAAKPATVSRNGAGPRAVQAAPPASGEPEELLLTPPTPKPLRDKDGLEMRVRVYSASEEVLLRRGLAVGKRKNVEGTVWSVIPDGETGSREYHSPPCVVKRLKPKVN